MDNREAGRVRYLFLLPELFKNKGGIEVYNQSILRALSGKSADVVCRALVLNDRRAPEPYPFNPNVELVPCASSSARIVQKVLFVLRALFHARAFRPHLVVCGHVNFVWVCLLLNRVFGVDYVVLTYGWEVWRLEGRLAREGLRRARKVFSISGYTKERLQTQLPELGGRVELLPCTVDAERFTPGAKSPGLVERYDLEGKQLILTVGRLSHEEGRKGFDTVLRALPRILLHRPDVKYMIIGKGEHLHHLRARAEELGVRDSVIFAGFVPDEEIVAHYNLCDVFVMPSKQEGFGIVFLEALACGKPVIAGDRDGSKDALLGGELGLLVDPDDTDHVARAVLSVINGEVDKQYRNGSRLRQAVVANFGPRRFESRVFSLFGLNN